MAGNQLIKVRPRQFGKCDMLRRYAAFFSLLRSIIDIVIIGCAWIAVYYLRFYSGIFSVSKGIADIKRHLVLGLPIICICYLAGLWTGFYKPKRVQTGFKQFVEVLKATFLSGLLVLAFFYYIQDAPYSRKLLILFIVMLFAGLSFSHLFAMCILQLLRKKGHNLRYYAIIGAGKKGQLLVRDIEQIGWLGLKCRFFVDNNPSRIGTELSGVPVYGPVEKLTEFVKSKKVDEIFLTGLVLWYASYRTGAT
jgi:FlaA1/EpsC-like NDP-sugar epimerase